jgi:hypothetical protein
MHTWSAEIMLKHMLADPEGMETISLAYAGLREERWGEDYIDAIGQHALTPARSWPMEQVAAFAMVHHLVYSGEVAQVLVGTRGTPHRDADRKGNAAALARLPGPFTAEVDMYQSNAGSDGTVSWDEPIWVELLTGLIERREDGSTAPYPLRFLIPPGHAPLEIGSSLPSKTWAHLVADHGAVARWPYGHSSFRLFVNLGFMTMKNEFAERFVRGMLERRQELDDEE